MDQQPSTGLRNGGGPFRTSYGVHYNSNETVPGDNLAVRCPKHGGEGSHHH